MLTALLTVVIIGLALGSYLWVVSNQNQSTMRSLAWNSAIPVVEAGLEEALMKALWNGYVAVAWNEIDPNAPIN